MNPYHAKLLPQLPPRPVVAAAAVPPRQATTSNSSGFHGGGNNPTNAGGAIGFGNEGGGGGSGRNQQYNQRGPQQFSSSSSASARGVVFFTVKPGEHPATINGLRGKIAVDYTAGATTEDVLNQIAELHQISRSKFTVTATEQSRGTENLKPTDRIKNYERITVTVVPADMGGGSGNNNTSSSAGGGIGHITSGGGSSSAFGGRRGNNNNNCITIIDDEEGLMITSPNTTTTTTDTNYGGVSGGSAVVDVPCISLEREAALSCLDVPLNLPVLDRPEVQTTMAGKKPLCALCGEEVVVVPASTATAGASAAEYTFTSAESMQTHCCLRFACEQCCQYAVDVLGASVDHCPICNSLTDEALAKSFAANNNNGSGAVDGSSLFAAKKFATELKGETASAPVMYPVVPVTASFTSSAGVKREREEVEEKEGGKTIMASNAPPSTTTNHDGNNTVTPSADVEGGVEEAVTKEEASSSSDDDDDLLDGGGTLMF